LYCAGPQEVKYSVKPPRKPAACLYGDGRAAPRIAAVVAAALKDRERLLRKRFSDEVGSFVAPWIPEAADKSNAKNTAA